MLTGGRFGDPIEGAQVLDLFAGTGALGLEALSRGAAHVVFVENGRAGQSLIRENIVRLGYGSDVRGFDLPLTRPIKWAGLRMTGMDFVYDKQTSARQILTGLYGSEHDFELAATSGTTPPTSTIC